MTRRVRPTGCWWLPPATDYHKAMPIPVREHRRLHRTADARRPALRQLHPGLYPRGDDAGCLRGCRGDRLALPVLHLREEGRGLRRPEEEQENHARRTSRPPPSSSPRTGSYAIWWKTPSAASGCSTVPIPSLVEQMDYYIKPEQPETDFLKISKPEEIKICDPACGSGHMLIYAFDLLYAIYEEEGYEPAEIPEMILDQQPLRHRDRRTRRGAGRLCPDHEGPRQAAPLFQQEASAPNICVLENIHFEEGELKDYMDFVGRICSPHRCKPPCASLKRPTTSAP